MSELRKDPITERWVIIATERAKRPHAFSEAKETGESLSSCPFCEGHEDMTPPEIIAYRKRDTKPNTPGWWVRVVPNINPVLKIEGKFKKWGEGLYDLMSGVGANEVIIEFSAHNKNFANASEKEIGEVLWMYKERIIDLKKDPRFKYALIFKNQGKRAGGRISHPHSQIIATPVVPLRVEEELAGAKAYYDYKDRCPYCDIIREEMRGKRERIIVETEKFLAHAPFASRFPYEIHVLPKKHSPCYCSLERDEVLDLSYVMKEVFSKLYKLLGRPPFNFVLHTCPFNIRKKEYSLMDEYYHWHIEIMPRLTEIAGFEWGSGFYINPVPPEFAAKLLTEIDQEEDKKDE